MKVEAVEVNGYYLSIEEIPEGEPCAGAYRVKAEPINTFGYMFYAYKDVETARLCFDNLKRGRFDDQVYRVNFNPDNARLFKK